MKYDVFFKFYNCIALDPFLEMFNKYTWSTNFYDAKNKVMCIILENQRKES